MSQIFTTLVKLPIYQLVFSRALGKTLAGNQIIIGVPAFPLAQISPLGPGQELECNGVLAFDWHRSDLQALS